MVRCFSFKRDGEAVLVPVDMSDAQARRARARAHEVRKMDGTAKSRKPVADSAAARERMYIDQRYENPAPGVHIIDVGCYLPRGDDLTRTLKGLARKAQAAMKARQATAVYKNIGAMMGAIQQHERWHTEQRNNILGTFARYMPDFCTSKALRDSVTEVRFEYVGPKASDPDNLVPRCKGPQDTVCAFLLWGPVFDPMKIGLADGQVLYSPQNPKGRVMPSWGQDIRTVPRDEPSRYGVRIELHQGAFKRE